MTATDELRKLLNERGVEHSDFASAYRLSTRWQDNSRRVIEHQLRKDADIGDMGIVRNLTPEQAIAATLGAGTCEVEGYDDGMDEGMDGDWYSYAPPTWYLSCGHRCDGSERPSFCPMCGRKVVHGDS